MTAPPSDAFTLAMAHSSSSSSSPPTPRRSSRSRSITRSPSPKISFAGPTHHHPHPHSHPHPPPLRQRKSKPEKPLAQVVEADDTAAPVSPPAAAVSDDDKGKKIDWEIPRKTLHSSIGFLTLWLYTTGGSPAPVVRALAAALCVIVPADVLRLHYPPFARVYEAVLGFLMRESEKRKTNGVIWYILGVLWVLALYPTDIAVMSILILSWADTAASTFGRLWGRYTPPLPRRLLGLPLAPRKSLAGSTAAALAGAGIVAAFWLQVAPAVDAAKASWSIVDGARVSSPLDDTVRAWIRESFDWQGVHTGGALGAAAVVLGAGLVTALAEALDLGEMDDNLTLPILAGGAVWAIVKGMAWIGV